MTCSLCCASVAGLGTELVHIRGIDIALVGIVSQVEFAPIISVHTSGFDDWFKGKFLTRGSRPKAFFGRAAPLFGIFGGTPTMRTIRFFQRGSMHFECNFEMRLWWLLPMWWNRIYFGIVIKGVLVSVFGVIMNKNATSKADSVSDDLGVLPISMIAPIAQRDLPRIPRSIKLAWTSMKALGGFIKQDISRCQNYFVSITLEIFNQNWPRFRVL